MTKTSTVSTAPTGVVTEARQRVVEWLAEQQPCHAGEHGGQQHHGGETLRDRRADRRRVSP